MNTLNKALYAVVGAAVGAGVIYYMTQKDTEDFQQKLDALNEKTKEGCDSVREWFAAENNSSPTDTA